MPQPLSQVVPPPQNIMFYTDTAAKQPDLAALVAHAIGIWSNVEYTLGTTLVDMLGAKASPAIAMYGAIHETARQASLKAAAGLVLTQEHHDLFVALMRLHKPLARQRHKFAHWLWAYCEKAPQYLVLVDPVKFVRQHAWVSEVRFRQAYPSPSLKFGFVGAEEWFCYSKTELEQIIASFLEVLNLLRWFQHLVGPSPLPRKDEIYQFLIAQPLLAKELSRQPSAEGTPSEPE